MGFTMRRSIPAALDVNQFPLTLAGGLRASFADIASESLPDGLTALMRRLDANQGEQGHPSMRMIWIFGRPQRGETSRRRTEVERAALPPRAGWPSLFEDDIRPPSISRLFESSLQQRPPFVQKMMFWHRAGQT
jgi:hypothetical protein